MPGAHGTCTAAPLTSGCAAWPPMDEEYFPMPENHDTANQTATAETANVEFTEAAVPAAEPAEAAVPAAEPAEAAAPAAAEPEEDGVRFADLGIDGRVLAALQDVGYEKPSPIQAATIPLLLEGRDVVGLAQTGTGKTAAFA